MVMKISEETIKKATGQFDLETVYKLSMQQMGLKRIEGLTLCPNLTELDLSHNNITRIEGLDALDELKRLKIADNQIERIENVSLLNSLETLHLEGNKISNLDEVQMLSKLPCLRHLSFQTSSSELRNPVCDHPGYYPAVRRMLPLLDSLDGERTVLADAAVPQVTPLENLMLPTPIPWIKDYSFETDAPSKLPPLEGVQAFDEALTDCKRLSARARSLIDDYKQIPSK
mmetsp:Transcript_16660/g.39759  ORF Transcript_16660/g.39759 Transcript_16660/m.39759 type:complete len:229 (-) Transcript_16660:185-871(-)